MKNEESKVNAKNIIAIGITALAVIVTIMVTIKSLTVSKPEDSGLDFVAKSLIPLIGTWMGAIIAYYFAKENFDAATKQYDKVIEKLTPEKKLESVKVADAMRPFKDIIWLPLEASMKTTLLDGILQNKKYENINRFLFLQDKVCKYIIHRSTFDRFITIRVAKQENEIKTLTFENFLNAEEQEIKIFLNKGIEFISIEATLLDARKLLEKNRRSQDIIVTANGRGDEEMLGWITDVIIAEHSKV
jgi:hypothetical protein